MNLMVTEDDEEEQDEEEVVKENEPTIMKLRKLIRKVRKSPQMRQKLCKHCEFYGMDYLVPIIDVATRWNSTYEMLQRAETLKTPLRALCLSHKKMQNLLMSEGEWNSLNRLKALLEKFDRSTQLISMERHPTISAYIPTLDWLISSLESFIEKNTGPLGDAAEEGLDKLKKYEAELVIQRSQIPYVATFLNPALKLNYFREHNYTKQSVKEIQQTISGLFEKSYDKRAVGQKNVRAGSSQGKTNLGGSDVVAGSSKDHETDEFFSHMFKRSKESKQQKEFQKYINSPLSAANVNVLDYWRSQVNELPHLSMMARDYLAVQSGSVAVERDFSGGADLVTPTRCSLQKQSIRACMCLKSWYKLSISESGLSGINITLNWILNL